MEPISYPVFQRNAKRTVHERCVLAVSLAGAPQSDILAANKFHGAFASCAGYLLATGNVFAQVPTSPRTFPPPEKDLLAADGTWLPYVNQENGKVLDLKSDPPKVLTTLGDAYALALSPDKSQLWAVDRKEIFGIATDANVSLAVVDSKEAAIAFVPSKSGLLRYELNTLRGTKVTENPACTVFSTKGAGFSPQACKHLTAHSVVSGSYIRLRALTARRSVKRRMVWESQFRES